MDGQFRNSEGTFLVHILLAVIRWRYALFDPGPPLPSLVGSPTYRSVSPNPHPYDGRGLSAMGI